MRKRCTYLTKNYYSFIKLILEDNNLDHHTYGPTVGKFWFDLFPTQL